MSIWLYIDEPSGGLTDQTKRMWAGGGQVTFSNQLGQRGTSQISLFVHAGDTYQPSIGAPVYIYEQDDDPPLTLFDDAPGLFDSAPGVFDAYGSASPVCVYRGTIETLQTKWHGGDGEREITLGCVSLEQTLDAILVSKAYYSTHPIDDWNCGKIILDLFVYFGSGLSLAPGIVQDGVDVPSIIFDQTRLSDALNQLAQLSGFIWYVNPMDGLLYFQLPAEAAAPFTLTDDYPLFETLDLSQTRQDYRNRQIVRIAPSAAQSSIAAIKGTGAAEYNLYWQTLAIGSAVLSTDTVASMDVTFSGLPTDGDTITVNSGRAYTWKNTLDNTLEDQIKIGATASECAQNLADALDAEPFTAGVGFSLPTQENADVTAWWHGVVAIGVRPLPTATSLLVSVYAKLKGAVGNGGFFSTTSAAYTFSNSGVLAGGTGTGSGDVTLTLVQGIVGTTPDAGSLLWEPGAVEVHLHSPISSGTLLYVVFRRLGADCVAVENTASKNTRATVEHGTGKYQLLISDTSLTSYATAYAEALSWLEAYDTLPDTLTFETDSPFLTPGMNLVVSLTDPTGAPALLNGTWLVREVDATLVPGFADSAEGHFRYTVMVINQTAIVNYIAFWLGLAGGSGQATVGGSAGSSGGGSSGPNLLSGTQSVASPGLAIVQHGGTTGAGAAAAMTTSQAPGANTMIVTIAGLATDPRNSFVTASVTDNLGTVYTRVLVADPGPEPGGAGGEYHSILAIFVGYPSGNVPLTISATMTINNVSGGALPQLALTYTEISGLFEIDTFVAGVHGSLSATVVTSVSTLVFFAWAGSLGGGGTPISPLVLLDSPTYGTNPLATSYDSPVVAGSNYFAMSTSDTRGVAAAVAFKITASGFNPGKDGDFYIDLTYNRLFGPRSTGTWPSKSWALGVPN